MGNYAQNMQKSSSCNVIIKKPKSRYKFKAKKVEEEEKNKYGLKVQEKIEIGALAKTVIDNARRDYLLKTFPALTAKTLQYCTLETSLESSAIILS